MLDEQPTTPWLTNRSTRTTAAKGADQHTAATLAAALIAYGFTLPAATNATMAARQAVDLYRSVLRQLQNPEVDVVDNLARTPRHASSEEQLEMDVLGVIRVDFAKFCYGDYRYDKLSDALRYARANPSA